jgi:hypothetical protein
MAHVIPFRIGARSEQRERAPGSSAEIVIFPGVRYEYSIAAEPPPPPAKPKRKSGKQRDRLDLVE